MTKYETPELIALAPAIQVIHGLGLKKHIGLGEHQSITTQGLNELALAYADWE
jgi:hypothetical protein